MNIHLSWSISESAIAKDVTLLITRVGDFRADSKIKWVDLCESFIPLENNRREYRVSP
jgi:hypothetical protein